MLKLRKKFSKRALLTKKNLKMQIIITLFILFGIGFNFITLGFVNATPNENIGFEAGDAFLYKNIHYNLDEQGERTLNVTKWSLLNITNIEESDNGEITEVFFSKYDAIDVGLEEIDQNPELLLFDFATPLNIGVIVLGVINQSEPQSHYQVLFNAKNASMLDLEPSIMTDGQFFLFYRNELSYFKNQYEQHRENNTVDTYHLTPTIIDQKTRTFEGKLEGEAKIRLNSSFPGNADAWYNSSFDLDLYLVYGQETNILLSYNINFTIAEHYYDEETDSIEHKYQRKIIFWNIRQPEELTEDYPIIEVLDIPTLNFQTIGAFSLASIGALTVGFFRRKK